MSDSASSGPSGALALPQLPGLAGGAAETEVLEGLVERVVFTSADGDFAVLRLEFTDRERARDGRAVVIGPLAHVAEGETLRVSGRWEAHPQYGPRFRALHGLSIVPQTLVGIERYLATLSGLGPELARRLVAEFGINAIDVLENETWRAAQLKGVGKRRSKRAAADARARREEREVMIFLQGQGISAAYATRIRKIYGEAAMARVRENPYRLARDVPGIGFQIADRIARNMGVPPLSPLRIEAGLVYALEHASDAGHCFLPAGELQSRAVQLLRLAEESPRPAEDAVIIDRSEDQDAAARLPELLEEGMAALSRPPDDLRSEPAAIVEEGRFFLPRLYRAEVALSRRLAELRQSERRSVPRVQADRAVPPLAAGQRRALHMIEESPVCVITGGPGTGKTTIIRNLVATWEGASRRVLLAAPTGRAAKRLSEATGRPASTVHRLLEWAPKEGFRRRSDNLLQVDLLVCDEASMLDLPLARALVQAVPRGATLVLVGDVDQLPSVGPGRVLGDVIGSGAVPVARLTDIFRQAEGSGIVENAHRILHGGMPVSAPRAEDAGDFYFIEADEPLRARELVLRLVTERIPQRFGLDPLREVQVLTPMHRGEVGTEELNRALQAALNPAPDGAPAEAPEAGRRRRAFRRGDKVIQVRNDYERDVWNGDVGVVEAPPPPQGDEADDAGAIGVRVDDRLVRYGSDEQDQLELAYAISVHKSQGSEYPAVVVPILTQHWVMLRRNLLYTAVTRGKRLVVLVGSRRALQRAVQEHTDVLRYTWLRERLAGEVGA